MAVTSVNEAQGKGENPSWHCGACVLMRTNARTTQWGLCCHLLVPFTATEAFCCWCYCCCIRSLHLFGAELFVERYWQGLKRTAARTTLVWGAKSQDSVNKPQRERDAGMRHFHFSFIVGGKYYTSHTHKPQIWNEREAEPQRETDKQKGVPIETELPACHILIIIFSIKWGGGYEAFSFFIHCRRQILY